jgi:STE24 endopeptidase
VRVVLVVVGALAGRRLAQALDVPGPLLVDALVFALIAGGLLELLLLPFAFARYRLAREAGISRQSVREWLGDLLKGGLLALVFGTLAIAGIVWLARIESRWWWAIAVVASIAVELLVTAVAPVLLVPIFLRSRPLAAGALRDDLLGLAARAGVSVGSVRVLQAGAKTASANAAVMGIGPTRRIVLTDTLIDEAAVDDRSISEVRAVLGHELGHHRSRDLWRFAGLCALSTFVTFGVGAWLLDRLPQALAHGGPRTLAGVPALALSLGVVGLPLSLVSAYYSRRRERAADAFGVEVAGDPEAFARALEGLCRTNLAEHWPPRLVRLRASHPAPGERIARARGSGE